jgi:hypothetical protein
LNKRLKKVFNESGDKRCNKCFKFKEMSNFHKNRNQCKECIKTMWNKYHIKNSQKRNRQSLKYYYNHKEEIAQKNYNLYHSDIKYKEKRLKNRIEWNKNNKIKVLEYYTNPKGIIQCNCCNEKNINFLCIDHINGNGNKHRIESGSHDLYSWLLKNNLPIGFQVLCYNCNLNKHNNNICFHQRIIFNSKIYNKRYINYKKIALIHYSNNEIPFCKCCGENEINFLSIDHINGNGTKHRKQIGNRNFYQWLKVNQFPQDYQVLCYNCNLGKRDKKSCPHTLQPKPLNFTNLHD